MRMILLTLCVILTGCASPDAAPETPVIKFEPTENTPVSVYVPKFYVVTPENVDQLLKEKKVLIATDFNDSIELRKSFEDINTYILKQNESIKIMRTEK